MSTTPHTADVARSLQAFAGQASQRTALIERLQAHVEAGRQVQAPGVFWQAQPPLGNLAGLAAQADGDAAYEAATGLPAALARTHEALVGIAQTLAPSADESEPPRRLTPPWLLPHLIGWLYAIEPGRDMRRALPVFECRLAGVLLDGAPVLGELAAPVHALVARWREGRQAELEGQPLSASVWATLRADCAGLALTPGTPDALVAELVESVAWPEAEVVDEWLQAWPFFLQQAVRVRLETELPAEIASLYLASMAAWQRLEAAADADASFDFAAAAAQEPALQASGAPEVQQAIEAALAGRARPLAERLLDLWTQSMRDPMSSAVAAASAVPAAASGEVTDLTADEFEPRVMQAQGLVLVDYWAPWCGPCVQFAPTLAAIAAQFAGRVTVVKVNVDENRELADAQGVRALPTLALYRNGAALARATALSRSRVASLLESHLA